MEQTKTPYQGLRAGVYLASIVDWGIREARISDSNKPLMVYIQFDFECDGKVHRITFESFLLKKDGDVNQKTIDSLVACGFKGADIAQLQSDTALNTFKKVNITVELENGYWKVQWVNDPDQSPRGKAEDVKSLQGYDLSKINSALAQKKMAQPSAPNVKNHAPTGAVGADGKTDNERGLGF